MKKIYGWAALAAIIAVALAAAAGELAAALLSPGISPITAVGSAVIELMPPPLTEWAIDTFGSANRTALLVSMSVVMAVLAAGAGIAEYRRRYTGAAVIIVFAVLGLLAVLAMPQAGPGAVLAPVITGAVGVLVLLALIKRLRRWNEQTGDESAVARRGFLQATGAGALVAVVGVAASASVRGVQVGVANLRAAVSLPPPAVPADSIPPGAVLDLEGVPPLVTPNPQFYRIDTALRVPRVESDGWRLRVTGMVENEVEISFQDLLAKPLIEHYITLACVSNPVGGDLISNAKWLGWPIRELLAEARPTAGADMVLSRSVDGWTAGTPLEALTDERQALLAVGMNDAPLPFEHGFPVRMVVPGLFGYVSATKWVTELNVTRFADEDAYWTVRGWTARGPVITSSRIDHPSNGATLSAGLIRVGGYAWAQNLGIRAVQLQVDGGEWQDAQLAAAISADTWRQWVAPVELEPGQHELTARAIDNDGEIQIAEIASPIPSGATGLHSITVQIQ